MRKEKEFLYFIQNIHKIKGSEGSEGSKGSEGVVAAGAAVYSLLPQEGVAPRVVVAPFSPIFLPPVGGKALQFLL